MTKDSAGPDGAHIPGHIHLDAVGGIAGDMFVACLVSALPELRERVLNDCRAVLPEPLKPGFTKRVTGGIAALGFGLSREAQGGSVREPDATTYTAMRQMIECAPLEAGTATEAAAILHQIADAESQIHAVPIEQVHFHELADWDSLMDVVAAGSVAAALSGTSWSVSELPIGSGTIETRHGLLPALSPAAAHLLRGFKLHDDDVPGERVTPTGAAVLAHLIPLQGSYRGQRPGGRLAASGFGAGTRDLPGMANVLRALVFETTTMEEMQDIAVISFDVDDMTGEELAVAADRLRAEDGVIDLAMTACVGKKGRVGQEFRLLVRPTNVEAVADTCFEETSTLGLRWRVEQRITLARETVDSNGVRVKRARRPDGRLTAKAESDDLCRVPGLSARRAVRAKAERGASE